jgi:hypothetical protein
VIAPVVVRLTEEQRQRWETLTERLRLRQEASERAGPLAEVEVQVPDGTVLDRWKVPACSTSGAW